MVTAKKPYTTRSNHSSALPIEAATTARHEFCRLPATLAAVVAFIQISCAARIIYRRERVTPALAAPATRTAGTTPCALFN
jgi:hypothetical protein